MIRFSLYEKVPKGDHVMIPGQGTYETEFAGIKIAVSNPKLTPLYLKVKI